MPNITTCSVCGRPFEARSAEEANEPIRFCPGHRHVGAAEEPGLSRYVPPPRINIVLVREDGLVTSGQADGWRNAAARAVEWADRNNGQGLSPVARVFLSAGPKLEEHTVAGLRRDLAAGEVPQ